jgi:hypothetical protein
VPRARVRVVPPGDDDAVARQHDLRSLRVTGGVADVRLGVEGLSTISAVREEDIGETAGRGRFPDDIDVVAVDLDLRVEGARS